MKERFLDWKPSRESAGLFVHIDKILDSYEKQGYRLTLRQLYYQLVARDLIPNSTKSYDRLGNITNRGRLAGYIDWAMIEDRARTPRVNPHWDSPKDIVLSAAKQYYEARWPDQEWYIEVWCEKDAVSNILNPVCRRWDVLFLANRGYNSQTAMYDSSKRFQEALDDNKSVRVLYFGDHDPSGIDMSEDIQRRLGLFLQGPDELFESLDRVALTMEQIRQYRPPENPAKEVDPRYAKYAAKYGESSWELDALEPSVLAALTDSAIQQYADDTIFEQVQEREESRKQQIRKLAESL